MPDLDIYDKSIYVNVAQCTNEGCLLVGMHPEMSEHNPCPLCGSAVKDAGAAKWVIIPDGTRPVFFGLFKARKFKGVWVPARQPKDQQP